MRRREIVEVARAWVGKAEHDLRNAQYVMTMPEESCPYDTVCFHAQQTVEKYLKALLTCGGVEYRRTHDLTELLLLLPEPDREGIHMHDLAALNPYAVEGRYPGVWDEVPRANAIAAMTAASEVRLLLRSRLPKEVLGEQA